MDPDQLAAWGWTAADNAPFAVCGGHVHQWTAGGLFMEVTA